MIKVSAIRSALRRQALVKAAAADDAYNDMLQSLATRYRADSPVGPGTRIAVRDVRRKEGLKPPVPARTPVTARAAVASATPAARPKPAAPSQAYSGPPFWAPAADAMARGVGRAVEWGAYWPDHLKAWWNKTFRR